jgi:ABC-type transport system involved in cytochrome bd biosynthesis fused ATPase/permease subunit|tara:strand:- start:1892 stop:2113 length:222 start_codon:yes stop_codon:yes gene_type:complete
VDVREIARYMFGAAFLILLSWGSYQAVRHIGHLYHLVKANKQVIENTRQWVEDIEKEQCRPETITMESTFNVM